MTHLDHPTYKLLKTQVSPDKVEDKTYEQWKTVLLNHYSPKPPIIAERFVFWCHDQKAGESVADFAAELRRLSYTCEFGDFLLQTFRDRRCGLLDIVTQKKLLTVKDLTFQSALDTAVAAECAAKGAQRVNQSANAYNYVGGHKKRNRGHSNRSRNKYNASIKIRGFQVSQRVRPISQVPQMHSPHVIVVEGKATPHPTADTYKCNHCSQTGHLAKVCRNKHVGNIYVGADHAQHSHSVSEDVSTSGAAGGCECPCTGGSPISNAYYMCDDNIQSQSDPLGTYKVDVDSTGLYKVKHAIKKSNGPITVDVTVSGVDVTMELDTGSAYTIVPESMFQAKLPHIALHSSEVRLETYSGQPLTLLGQASVEVVYDSQRYKLLLLVAKFEANQPAIFGRNWLHVIKLMWEELFCHNVMHVSELGSIIGKHPTLFKSGLNTMRHHKAVVHVKKDARPVFRKARPVPYAIKPQLEAEYKRLQKERYIDICLTFRVGLSSSPSCEE